ncbi:MAG TPA: methylated-DNA--[protein]-cysteine S-methyltransferase [Candidatus Saccharimonadales bacterium]|nr:methylated-DNA--[protein]-cysteine S-methyltransferase [Candidatus Saccharimonadales bacterium]
MIIETAEMRSPVGPLVVHVKEGRLCGLSFRDGVASTMKHLEGRFGEFTVRRSKDPAGVISRLRAYFGGDLDALDAIEVDTGGTPFQQSVWRELRRIPAGKTISYGELARRIRRPRAVRAVGAANGANPVAIVIPCHRVIGANGHLVGYGGGLDRKTRLLELERAMPAHLPGLR